MTEYIIRLRSFTRISLTFSRLITRELSSGLSGFSLQNCMATRVNIFTFVYKIPIL